MQSLLKRIPLEDSMFFIEKLEFTNNKMKDMFVTKSKTLLKVNTL